MNKFKKAILAAGIVTVISGVNVYIALANTGKVTKETVRMRESASTDSNILVNMDYGDEVEIIGEEGEWYKVKYLDYEGYMFKEYVESSTGTVKESATPEPTAKPTVEPTEKTEEKTEEETKPTKVNYAGAKITIEKESNLYLYPVLLSSRLIAIPTGTEITVLKEINNWIEVSYEGKTGWIVKPKNATIENENVSNYTEESEEEETEVAATTTSRKGKANVDGVNVRETASSSAEVISSLSLDEEVNIIGEENDYYKISSDKIKEGYVAKRLIDEEKVTSRSGMREDEPETEQVEEQPEPVNQPVQEYVQEEEEEEETVYTDYPPDDVYEEESNESSYVAPSYNAQTGNEVVDFALQFEGYDYVYGGTTPSGFDCTGFAYYVYNNCGIDLARTIGYQMETGDEVDFNDMEPGDLIVFYDSGYSEAGHVGIYIGGDEFIHASNPSRGVRIDSTYSSYYNPRIITIRRIQ